MHCHEGIYLQSSNCFLQHKKAQMIFMKIPDAYLLLINDNISIHQNVIKEKKLPCFWLFSTLFGQNSFPNQHSARNTKRLWIAKKKGNHKSSPVIYRLLLVPKKNTNLLQVQLPSGLLQQISEQLLILMFYIYL